MRLVIGHYHLEPGGVTRVIESQLASLAGSPLFEEIVLVAGHVPAPALRSFPARARLVIDPDLDYLDGSTTAGAFEARARRILSRLRTLAGGRAILHFHNPNLGKNPALTAALATLAREGTPLLLHCHDFAEDRPEALAFLRRLIGEEALREVMYPSRPSCHYGLLTRADRERALASGIAAERAHLLPNPVALDPLAAGLSAPEAKRLVCETFALPPGRELLLYPVRVIPRKNAGEAILLAALFRDRASCLVTLPPHNPAWRPAYERWKSFAAETGAPIVFEAGVRLPLATLMTAADRVLTTSVREGFGMVYLEPWLSGRPVVGRRIDAVVRDFEEAGVVFDGLYGGIPVPEAGRPRDFAELGEEAQRATVRAVMTGGDLSRALRSALEPTVFAPADEARIAANRARIEQEYSLERYRERLLGVYAALAPAARSA